MQNYEQKDFIDNQENIYLAHFDQDFCSPTHTHDFVELIFIAAGSCRQIIDGVGYDAEAGDLFFVNFGQTHAFCSDTRDLQYYNLLYVPRFFSEELMDSENIYEIKIGSVDTTKACLPGQSLSEYSTKQEIGVYRAAIISHRRERRGRRSLQFIA